MKLLLVLLSVCPISNTVGTTRCTEWDESMTNQRLPVDAYQVLDLSELRECVFACDQNEKCQSYNYDLMQLKCYLIDTNRHFTSVSLVDEKNWIHSDSFWHPCFTDKDKCYGRPCDTGGKLNCEQYHNITFLFLHIVFLLKQRNTILEQE